MKKLFSKSKILFYILGIFSGIIILSSLFFMTQYRNIRVNYRLNNGEYEYLESNTLNDSDQSKLFIFINDLANGYYNEATLQEGNDTRKAQELIDKNEIIQTVLTKDSSTGEYKYLTYEEIKNSWTIEYKYQYTNEVFTMIRDFRVKVDNVNNMILIFGIITLITFAILLILSNHDRKIYYKENLIGGVLLPIVNIALMVVLIINCISLMGDISDPIKNAFYNMFSVSQNAAVAQNIGVAVTDKTNQTQIQNIINSFNVNSTTLVGYIAMFAVYAAYNVFIIVLSVLKYKDTAKERNDVLERARLAGEKA